MKVRTESSQSQIQTSPESGKTSQSESKWMAKSLCDKQNDELSVKDVAYV